jgi:predicted ATPase
LILHAASAKFDQARKSPFGPVLKLLSSLFKQVFSESNTDTPFHQMLKQYVRPAWPMLHKVLELPEFLLGAMTAPQKGHSNQLSHGYNKSLRAEFNRRDSSPSSSHAVSLYSMALGTQSSQDFLRAGTSTKSMRLMNTFLDVLRVFTQYKFICFCLDDLQYADDESLDLITQIVGSKMKMIIIVTVRPDEILPEKIKGTFSLFTLLSKFAYTTSLKAFERFEVQLCKLVERSNFNCSMQLNDAN